MIAYLTMTRKVKFLTIKTIDFQEIKKVAVANKTDAKNYCKQNNIKPWNF